jgi:MarR family transcriptional regulator, 2-MHQ and catechol-resistance regulon repressor
MPSIDKELKSRFESEQQKAMLNLMFTANWMRSKLADLYRPFGISTQQYNILRILRGAKDRMKMQSVKERMIDRAPNATRLTDKLIAKGLVERERCEEDRRVVYVRISEKGLELLALLDRKSKALQKEMEARLSDNDAGKLSSILDGWRG